MYYNIKKDGYSIKEILKLEENKYNILNNNEIENQEINTENLDNSNFNDVYNMEMPQENINNPNNNTDRRPRVPIFEFEEGYNRDREMELMRKLYTEINTLLYPFVINSIDEYEFIGSPIYSPMGVDRETIAQIVDNTIALAEESLDQVGEAKNERAGNYLREWDRWGLLRAAVESLVLNDIFAIRRPAYFKTYAPPILRQDF